MSIERFIKKITVQTAVYWGFPVNDGFGGFTYSIIIDIKCRWDGVTELITNSKGKEVVSSAKLLVDIDLNEEGYLYLGSLNDFVSGFDFSNPKNVDGAFSIQKIEKTPMIKSTTNFVRTVYL